MTPPQFEPFEHLINGYFEETLSSDEKEQLLSALNNVPVQAEFFRLNIWAHFLLQEHYNIVSQEKESLLDDEQMEDFGFSKQDPGLNTPLLVTTPISVERKGGFYRVKRRSSPSPNHPLSKQKTMSGKLLIGSLLFGGLLSLLLIFPRLFSLHDPLENRTQTTLIRISETLNAQWEPSGPSFKRGQGTGPEHFALKKGLVKLELENGTELLLQGPCDFSVSSLKSSFCRKGRVSAYVPSQASGFEVVTPFATLVDRGTEFVIEVDDKETKVGLLKGRIDCLPEKGPITSLSEGKGVAVPLTRKQYSIPLERISFMTRSRFQNQLLSYAQTQTDNANDFLTKQRSDPDLLVQLTFDEKQNFFSNKSTIGRETIPGARLIDGRKSVGPFWGTSAIELRGNRSHIELDIPGYYRSMTFMMNVRVDIWNQSSNYLFESQDFRKNPGSLLWMLTQHGAFKLFLNKSNTDAAQNAKPNYVPHQTKDIFTSSLSGCWSTIAIVFDRENQRIVQYFDGQEISSERWENPVDICPGNLILGNSVLKNKVDCSLNGAISWCCIYKKVLSEEEIKKGSSL